MTFSCDVYVCLYRVRLDGKLKMQVLKIASGVGDGLSLRLKYRRLKYRRLNGGLNGGNSKITDRNVEDLDIKNENIEN